MRWDCRCRCWDGGSGAVRPVFSGGHCGGPHGPAGRGGTGGDFRLRLYGSLGVAFIIGISRGITVLMNDGRITDTILHWGRDGPLRPWLHLLCAAGLFDLPAVVRADSVLLRAGDPVRAGGGAAGTVCRGRRRCGGDGVSVRLRPCESGDAHCRRGDGGAGAGTDPTKNG